MPLLTIKNAKIVSSEGKRVDHMLIGGGKILAVGDDVLSVRGVEVFDAEGRNVLPGFIDNHCHITGASGESGPHTRAPEIPASAFLHHGTTTVVGLLGADQLTRSLEVLIAKARALRFEGVNCYCLTGAYQFPVPTLTGKPERDCYFLEEVIGVGEIALSDYRSSEPSTAELRRMVKDCLRALRGKGIKGCFNFHLGDETSGTNPIVELLKLTDLPSDVVIATHINRNPQLLEEALSSELQSIWLDITAIYWNRSERSKGLFAEEAVSDLLGRDASLIDRLLVSSDGGTMVREGQATHPGWLFRAFRGVAEREGLRVATKIFCENPARALGLLHKGSLDSGMDADLVVLDDDLHIHTVVSQGKFRIVARRAVEELDYYGQGYSYAVDL